MDGFGLREYLFEMAKTIASRGYMADLPGYNEAALNRHWQKLFELLDKIK